MTDIEETIRLAQAASNRADWLEAIKYWQAVIDGYGDKIPKKIRIRLRQAQHAQNSLEAQRKNKLVYKAVADPKKIIWANPQNLKHKIRPQTDHALYPNAILSGDWDLDVVEVEQTTKYQSLIQHFRDGVEWERTDLFKGSYLSRLERGEPVRGCVTIVELKEKYRATVDTLHEDMKQRGFVLPADKSANSTYLPHVHIGREGAVLYGTKGNHRLTIAKLLKLDRIPCIVHARHVNWQKLREKIYCGSADDRHSLLSDELASHPDLVDLLT